MLLYGRGSLRILKYGRKLRDVQEWPTVPELLEATLALTSVKKRIGFDFSKSHNRSHIMAMADHAPSN